jgi:HSP20 family protein
LTKSSARNGVELEIIGYQIGAVMPLPTRRRAIPDLFDWLETPWPAFLPFGSSQTVRVEDYTEDGNYVIRAELPGIDPEKDVEVSVSAGVLTIRAERREETKKDHRSEFRYGSLTRSVSLPEGADPDKITAKYDKGILQVIVPVPERAKSEAHRIAVEH